jgi:hypothetical protein
MSSIRSELISTVLFPFPSTPLIIPYSSPASILPSLCGEQNLCLPFSSRL